MSLVKFYQINPWFQLFLSSKELTVSSVDLGKILSDFLNEMQGFSRRGGVGGEASPAKHRTFAKANVSLSNLASLRMWRRSFLLPACRRREIGDVCTQAIFSAVSTDFCQMILIKSWGKPWIIITRSSTLSSVQNNWGDPVWTSKSLSIRKKGLSIFSSCSRIYTFILRTKVEITSYCN